jgi:hypothetical protein
MTSYFGTHLDAGSAGAKTIGMTVPSGQQPAMGAIEILGTEGGSSIAPQASRHLAALRRH